MSRDARSVLRIREDRQALGAAHRDLARGGGRRRSRCWRSRTGSSRSSAATTTSRSPRTTASGPSRSPRRGATSSTATARPLVENEPAYTLHLYRREARDLEASIDFIVGPARALDREEVASRVERGRRAPEFVPIPIAENLGIEEVAAVEARVDRAPRVRHHGLAAPPLQARRLGGPRARLPRRGHARADQERRQRLPGRRLDRPEGRSRAPTSACSPEPTASGASSSTRTAAKCRRRTGSRPRPGRTSS